MQTLGFFLATFILACIATSSPYSPSFDILWAQIFGVLLEAISQLICPS